MRSSAGRSRTGDGDDARAPRGARGRAPSGGARGGRAGAKPGRRVSGPLSVAGLLEALDRGDFPGSLYLEGPCEPVKAALLAVLRGRWAASCPESPLARVFRAGESSVEDVLAAVQSASLFSPRDLVIVLEVEDYARSDKRVAALAQAIAGTSSPSTLALVESAAETPRRSLDALRRAAAVRVEATVPSRAELVRWGERRFAHESLKVEPGVAAQLADACEGDPLAFFSELDKLCVWAARDGRLGLADARSLLRPVVGSELSDYLAAVAAGHVGNATQRLGRLLAAGVSEGAILFSLSNLVGGALGGWARDRSASTALRRRSGPLALSHALDAVYRAEAAWKGGRADAVAVLEQATREVTGG